MQIDIKYLESHEWIEQDMRARFRWLRKHDPVYWSEKDQVWVITKFEDVAYCAKHQELFTPAEGVLLGLSVKLGLIDEAEPRHTQLRGLINRGFTPRMVTKDTELRGKRLLEGQHIVLAYPSANWDEDEFEDPDSFRIDHNPTHVAYACQHLHGGIGIDMDYPLHRYFTWAIQIEHELGSARHHLDHLGRMIAAHGLPAA